MSLFSPARWLRSTAEPATPKRAGFELTSLPKNVCHVSAQKKMLEQMRQTGAVGSGEWVGLTYAMATMVKTTLTDPSQTAGAAIAANPDARKISTV